MTRWAVAAAMALATAAPAHAQRAVTFSAADGTSLSGDLYEPSVRPSPAVLLVHMLGRNREDWDDMAERLEDAGVTVLAIDLRGHGRSGGSAATLAPLVGDVRAALSWLETRPGVRPGQVAAVGASLGANLVAVAAADMPSVRAVGLVSPSLDYRGLRLDANVMKKIGDRPVFLAASTQDPYALRTLRDLAAGGGIREQRLSDAAAHGTALLAADHDLATALVDWLKRTLIF